VDVYDVIVIGSALHMGQWRKDVVKFIQRNQKILKDKKVWIFSSGPTGDIDPFEGVQNRLFPEKLRTSIDMITPVQVTFSTET
jgi:menaquinone-dependent protoporphyrinogen oxidase